MGITGLLPFLQDSSRKCYINEFRSCTVAIDSYCWLHKGAFACAEKIVRGEETNIYINYCMKYVNLLLQHNIKPILVFDGQHLPAKKDTEKKRREQRKCARTRGVELLRLGKVEEARQCFRQCVDITHTMALALIKECRKRNIDCIVAPYEADAQLAYLNMQGLADIVITEDSDLILFGCTKILFKFSLDGSAVLVEHNKLNKAMKMRPDQYTFDKFRYMCILSGCDYLDSLPGIGLKKAHKAVTMTHNPDIYKLLPRLPSYLNSQTLTVPPEYIENFKIADATMRHQIVFDPVKRKLTHLTDPADIGTDDKYLRNAGTMYDNEKAFQMALGNIDPISLKTVDNWHPDSTHAEESSSNSVTTNSIWSRRYRKPKSEKNNAITPPNLSRTIVRKKIPMLSPEEIQARQEQIKSDYDKKLEEQLEIYTHRNPEHPPSPKRLKIDSKKDKVTEPEPASLPKSDIVFRNPFVKRISKFQLTNLNEGKNLKSRFFSSGIKSTNVEDASKTSSSVSNTEIPEVSSLSEERSEVKKTTTGISTPEETEDTNFILHDLRCISPPSPKEKLSDLEQSIEGLGEDPVNVKVTLLKRYLKNSGNKISVIKRGDSDNLLLKKSCATNELFKESVIQYDSDSCINSVSNVATSFDEMESTDGSPSRLREIPNCSEVHNDSQNPITDTNSLRNSNLYDNQVTSRDGHTSPVLSLYSERRNLFLSSYKYNKSKIKRYNRIKINEVSSEESDDNCIKTIENVIESNTDTDHLLSQTSDKENISINNSKEISLEDNISVKSLVVSDEEESDENLISLDNSTDKHLTNKNKSVDETEVKIKTQQEQVIVVCGDDNDVEFNASACLSSNTSNIVNAPEVSVNKNLNKNRELQVKSKYRKPQKKCKGFQLTINQMFNKMKTQD